MSAARTPVGSFGGALSSLPAVQLGNLAIDATLDRAARDDAQLKQTLRAQIGEVYMGNVLSAGLGRR